MLQSSIVYALPKYCWLNTLDAHLAEKTPTHKLADQNIAKLAFFPISIWLALCANTDPSSLLISLLSKVDTRKLMVTSDFVLNQ